MMKIYFMGIGGSAMGNAALLARAAGHDVIGSDAGVYPPMSTVLAEAGISVHEGYDAERLAQLAPDLVVIGNAMSRGHMEVEWLLESRALEFTSLPAFLAGFVLKGRRNVVIAGTHGKTTTTALTAYLLRSQGRDPGYLIGGVPLDPPTGNHLGAGTDPFVIEGDEYDSAFFDKRSKFIHYAPHIAVLNNLEFDHADIFRDLADVQRTFRHFTRIVPRNGWIVMNSDDANLAALGEMPWTRVIRVGTGENNNVRITNFEESTHGARFELTWKGEHWAQIEWPHAGIYNARNAAMAATAAQLSLLSDSENSEEGFARAITIESDAGKVDLSAFAKFRGVKRRQEVHVATPKLTVIEDFAHHPTALGEILRSLRAQYPQHRIHAAFEPRSNTSRTSIMQDDFMNALALADEVYIGAISRADTMKPNERFDIEGTIEFLKTKNVHGHTAPTHDALLATLREQSKNLKEPQLVVFFTNGSFGGIIADYVAGYG
jgi:UDP-N-acetylmuramate: L-alanyl-gamma-D-glutamyl-meso-diaminopimelate ligase